MLTEIVTIRNIMCSVSEETEEKLIEDIVAAFCLAEKCDFDMIEMASRQSAFNAVNELGKELNIIFGEGIFQTPRSKECEEFLSLREKKKKKVKKEK